MSRILISAIVLPAQELELPDEGSLGVDFQVELPMHCEKRLIWNRCKGARVQVDSDVFFGAV
eukprot:1800121-Rhodomonas_salina.1